MSDYEYDEYGFDEPDEQEVDPITAAYEADPAGTSAEIIAAVVQQEGAAIRAEQAARHDEQMAAALAASYPQAEAALLEKYGSEWTRHKLKVAAEYAKASQSGRELFSADVATNPQRLAEELEDLLLIARDRGKPTRAQEDEAAWEAVRKADSGGYVDRAFR